MPNASGVYVGDMEVRCTHEKSGVQLVVDPTGGSFSPTELCATALGACILLTMGYYGMKHGVDVTGTTFAVTEEYARDHRRIARLEVVFSMPDRPFSDREKRSIERAARACPVHNSLNPEIEQVLTFHWPQ